MKAQWRPLVYFLVGQAGWFACVVSAAKAVPSIGASIVAVLLMGHLAVASRPVEEAKLVAFAAALGAIWESAIVQLHLLSYPEGASIEGLAPYWIVALWALFGAQFNTTYSWLKTRPAAAAVLGALAGPLSFRAGAALGAVHFEKPLPAALLLAAGWALILPLLVFVSRRWDGVRSGPRS